MPILCNEGLKYNIKNHRTFKFSSHEIRNYETTIDLTHDKWDYPELEISTSVLSLLLRIQKVELDVTFIINSILWNIFVVPFDY